MTKSLNRSEKYKIRISIFKLIKSRNTREGKFLTTRNYKLGAYSRKMYKRDYALWTKQGPCEMCNCVKEYPNDPY